jgi:hypothetical protein
MKNLETLEVLELKLKENQKERIKIKEKIEELKTKEILPNLKNQYEGKFWKYLNSYNNDEKWWLYSYCINVIDENYGLFNTFQTIISKHNNENNFKINTEECFHLCKIEITKEEYLEALNNFKKNIENI